jgi:protein SCO1/2
MNRNMSEIYRKLDSADQVRFVSVSVDPERDSLIALRAYADSIGVDDNRWVFLRAPIDDVVRLCETGFMLPADGLPMGHTTRFALVDPHGRIRGYYDGMDEGSMKILLGHLRLLAGESI